MLCLDTNIIIDLFRGKLSLKNSQEEYAITPIIACELYKGAYPEVRKHEAAQIDELLSYTTFLEFNAEACKIFGELYAELCKKGKQTSDADLMIASICKSHDVTLVTSNKKDFENIPGLKLLAV